MRFYWLLLLLLAGCTSVPEKVTPVSPFELERYLGTWHEIARLDHRFERGLTQVTAEYSLRRHCALHRPAYCYSKNEIKLALGSALKPPTATASTDRQFRY